MFIGGGKGGGRPSQAFRFELLDSRQIGVRLFSAKKDHTPNGSEWRRNRVKDTDAAKKVSDDLTKLRERMTEVQKDAGNDYETHGWVSLFGKTMQGPRKHDVAEET